MERVDTVTEVETKALDSGKTLYIVKDSQGREYSTTYRNLAQVAQDATVTGAHVHLTFKEEKTDRGFIRRYLDGIEPLAEDTLGSAVGQALGQAQAAQALRPHEEEQPRISPSEAEKNLNIAKAVALKAAVDLVPQLPEEQRTVANVETMAEHFTRWLSSWRP
jgi:hypothetical protein